MQAGGSGGVEHVARHPLEVGLDTAHERLNLQQRGAVQAGIVRPCEVGHDGRQGQFRAVEQVGHVAVVLWCEPQTMHACVELQVDWPIGDAVRECPFLGHLDMGG